MTHRDFQKFIQKSLETLTARQIAGLFDISIPSVRRWEDGISIPADVMIPHVVAAIEKELEKTHGNV